MLPNHSTLSFVDLPVQHPIKKLQSPARLVELGFAAGRPVLGHSEQIRKRHDGTKVQERRDKGQDGTFRCLDRVHFFHADLDLD